MAHNEILLKVDGMTCNNCAEGITKSLRSKGFADADTDFMEGEVSFTLVDGKSAQLAIDQIEDLGYSVRGAHSDEIKAASTIEKKFLFALVFTVPLFMHMFAPDHWWINDPIVQLLLCVPVYILGFTHFGKSAWGSIKARYTNMDVLIFIGTTAAFVYSLAGTILFWGTDTVHSYLYFETTATIITLVLLGNVMEHRSIQQTSHSLGELSRLEPLVARIVLRVAGMEKLFLTTPNVVKEGDLLQVNEGDRFPTDGKVIEGTALVDESAISGESAPVQKELNSIVFSGTVIISGNVRVRATAEAKDSTLKKITELVKKARKEQPDIQKLGDKVSAVFVPSVLIVSVLTFTISYFAFDVSLTESLMNAIAVLVISCPCAMGLATPTAVVVGVGRAAKQGILIKGGDTIERFVKADIIIFDKTGTLTTGAFSPQIIKNNIGGRAISLIKSLESGSSHPIAKSLVAHWTDTVGETLTSVTESKGKGMSGIAENGDVIAFGKAAPGNDADLALTINGKEEAWLSIADRIKPGAREMIHFFQKEGLRVILLSGDKAEKVEEVARQLGITEWYGDVNPEGKLYKLEQFSANNRVAMVGDGVNDGPALSRAHVGIAPGGASSLAFDSARIVIMNSNEMDSLTMAFKTAKHTYLTIRQNLFWAFAYNVVAIPIAAFGFLNPMIAALAMAFSDVVVIGNSLRLKKKKLG